MIKAIYEYLRNLHRGYYFIKYDDQEFKVYFKGIFGLIIRTDRVRFNSIKAIYATSVENYFNLEIFLMNCKRIVVSQNTNKDHFLSTINFSEFIEILAHKCLNFNQHNLELAKEMECMPILCWHKDKKSPDLIMKKMEAGYFITEQGNDNVYTADDYRNIKRR